MSEAIALVPPPFDPAADLEVAFRKYMTGLVQLHGPSANTRASSIGGDCERAIFYDRTLPAELRTRHAPELQAIFELGKDFEKIAIRRLEDMGAEIIQRGRDYTDRRHYFSGHVDAKIRMPGWPKAIPVEIKGLNPYTGESIKTVEDIKNHRQSWVRKYYAQLQSYLYLDESELGGFVLFNKSTGWPTFINVPLDWEHAEGLLQRADRVQLSVVQNKPPERTLGEHCQRCPFVTACGPDIDWGRGATFLNDEELEALLRRRAELVASASEFHSIDTTIKEALPDQELVVVGDFVITGKLTHRRAEKEPRKAMDYWVRKIATLAEVKAGKK